MAHTSLLPSATEREQVRVSAPYSRQFPRAPSLTLCPPSPLFASLFNQAPDSLNRWTNSHFPRHFPSLFSLTFWACFSAGLADLGRGRRRQAGFRRGEPESLRSSLSAHFSLSCHNFRLTLPQHFLVVSLISLNSLPGLPRRHPELPRALQPGHSPPRVPRRR